MAIGNTPEQRVEQRPPEQPQEAKETPRETCWNTQQTEEKAHSPPLPSILLANVQSLENNMDDLRARISFSIPGTLGTATSFV